MKPTHLFHTLRSKGGCIHCTPEILCPTRAHVAKDVSNAPKSISPPPSQDACFRGTPLCLCHSQGVRYPLPMSEGLQQGDHVMTCMCCHGLMVEDDFLDFQGTTGFMWMRAWRCMNCPPYSIEGPMTPHHGTAEHSSQWYSFRGEGH